MGELLAKLAKIAREAWKGAEVEKAAIEAMPKVTSEVVGMSSVPMDESIVLQGSSESPIFFGPGRMPHTVGDVRLIDVNIPTNMPEVKIADPQIDVGDANLYINDALRFDKTQDMALTDINGDPAKIKFMISPGAVKEYSTSAIDDMAGQAMTGIEDATRWVYTNRDLVNQISVAKANEILENLAKTNPEIAANIDRYRLLIAEYVPLNPNIGYSKPTYAFLSTGLHDTSGNTASTILFNGINSSNNIIEFQTPLSYNPLLNNLSLQGTGFHEWTHSLLQRKDPGVTYLAGGLTRDEYNNIQTIIDQLEQSKLMETFSYIPNQVLQNPRYDLNYFLNRREIPAWFNTTGYMGGLQPGQVLPADVGVIQDFVRQFRSLQEPSPISGFRYVFAHPQHPAFQKIDWPKLWYLFTGQVYKQGGRLISRNKKHHG